MLALFHWRTFTFTILSILCSSICTRAQSPISVSFDKMNIVYRGIPNPITIAGIDLTDTLYRLVISKGALTEIGKGHYIYETNSTGKERLSIYFKNELVYQSDFRIHSIPAPKASLPGASNGLINASSLCLSKGLNLQLINFDHNMRFSLISYSLMIIRDTQVIHKGAYQTALFEEDLKKVLCALIPGDEIIFKDIVYQDPYTHLYDKTENLFLIVE